MDFQPVRAEDRETIERYFAVTDSRSSDMCFSTMYFWQDYYALTWTVCRDMLIFKSEHDENSHVSFSFPIGEADPAPALEEIEAYCDRRGIPMHLHNVYKEHEEWLNANMPDKFHLWYERDVADYIYETERLIRLSGKKYHGKKNHVNKFLKSYDDWAYEKITPQNREDCLNMLAEWELINESAKNREKDAEAQVARRSLIEIDRFGEAGGLIRAEGRVVAFSIGEKVNSDTFVVHIEKAFSDVPGAYAIINQQLLKHEAADIPYVNREDDAGEEGLRQAKLSYHPLYLLEKGFATRMSDMGID